MMEGYILRTLREIGKICKILDRQPLMRFVDEHSYLIRIHGKPKDKHLLKYYVPTWMRDFFFDPTRSRHLYSTSLVIDECQKAIKHITRDPNAGAHSYVDNGLVPFFKPTPTLFGEICNIAKATHFLESARNGSDRHELLLFLEYLSEIHWFDIYWHGDQGRRDLTDRIVHWVCTTLVGWFLTPNLMTH